MYRIATDIVTGYLAAGLITWTLLYVKEVIVTLADVIRRKAQEREDRRVREAAERAAVDAAARVEERFIQMIEQLNQNEADSSEVRFNREDLLQLLKEHGENSSQTQTPED